MDESRIAAFHHLVASALIPDNNVRQQAEKALSVEFEKDKESFICLLLHLLRQSPDSGVKNLSAILLRQKLPNSEPLVYDEISPALQEKVKKDLLEDLVNEKDLFLRSQIGDTIVSLAEVLIYRNLWPELVPSLYSLIRNEGNTGESLQILAMQIFGKLTSSADNLQANLADLHALLGQILASPNTSLATKSAACNTALKMVSIIEDDKQMHVYRDFIGPSLATLAALLNEENEDEASKVLAALVDVASNDPKYFRFHLEPLSHAMLQVGKTESLDDKTRQFCLELFASLAEESPPLVRKSKVTMVSALQLCFDILVHQEPDSDWAFQPDEEVFNGSNEDSAEVTLDRMAIALGGSKLVPLLTPIISGGLSSADWHHRNAALRFLAQSGEIYPFEKLPLQRVTECLKDEHPYVRLAALNCIGSLALDFSPFLQQQFTQILVPALFEPLKENNFPRLQCQAAATLFHIIDEAEAENIEPFVTPLLGFLMELLQRGHKIVQEQVLTTIAAIAGQTESFRAYYPQVMPLIKHIIVHATGKDMRTIRAKAMESGTYIGMHVGKDIFRPDATEMMSLFLQIIDAGGMEADDISQQYMLQACSRICTCLGEEFLPVLPRVIPFVWATLEAKVDLSHSDEEQKKLENGEISPYQLQYNGQAYTAQMEDKSNACSMLCSFAHDLGGSFFPFLEKSAALLINAMAFPTATSDIYSLAIGSQFDLLKCCIEAFRQGKTDLNAVRALFKTQGNTFIDRFKVEDDLELLQMLVQTFTTCIQEMKELTIECIDQAALDTIAQTLIKLLESSQKRIAHRELKLADEDVDEETMQQLYEENVAEDQLNFLVADCISAFVKLYKEAFLPTFNQLLPQIERMLQPNQPPGTRKIAIFIVDDIVEFLGLSAAPYYTAFIPVLLHGALSEDAPLRQAASYGLGQAADKGRHLFQPFIQESLKILREGIEQKDSRKEENSEATDNMISAFGRIIMHQSCPELLPLWLNYLPIEYDISEGLELYSTFCSLVEKEDPHLLGQNLCNLPRIFYILVHIIDTPFCEAESLHPRVLSLIHKFQGQLPPEAMQGLLHSLSKKEQKEIKQKLQTL